MAKPSGRDYAEAHKKEDNGDPGGDRPAAERAAAIKAQQDKAEAEHRERSGEKSPSYGAEKDQAEREQGHAAQTATPRNPQNPENLPVHGDGSGDEAIIRAKTQSTLAKTAEYGAADDRIDSQGGRTVGGASRQPSANTGGEIAGEDGDARRRAELAIDAENRRAALGPSDLAKRSRFDALDRLERELVRHERAYDDFVGGLMTAKLKDGAAAPKDGDKPPDLSPMGLHQMRYDALRVQTNRNSSPDDIAAAADRLAAVEFTAVRDYGRPAP